MVGGGVVGASVATSWPAGDVSTQWLVIEVGTASQAELVGLRPVPAAWPGWLRTGSTWSSAVSPRLRAVQDGLRYAHAFITDTRVGVLVPLSVFRLREIAASVARGWSGNG